MLAVWEFGCGKLADVGRCLGLRSAQCDRSAHSGTVLGRVVAYPFGAGIIFLIFAHSVYKSE